MFGRLPMAVPDKEVTIEMTPVGKVRKWLSNDRGIQRTLPSNSHIGNLGDSELHFLPALL